MWEKQDQDKAHFLVQTAQARACLTKPFLILCQPAKSHVAMTHPPIGLLRPHQHIRMKTPCAAVLLLSVAALLLPSHDAFKLPVGARLMRAPSSSPLTSARRTTTLPSFFPTTKALQASDAAVAEGDNSGAGQVWIEPAFHNKLSVRILAVLAGVGFAMKQTGVVVPKLAATYVHLMMYGAGFGSLMYTTFVLGLVLFKNLPRQTFGKLQSKVCVRDCVGLAFLALTRRRVVWLCCAMPIGRDCANPIFV